MKRNILVLLAFLLISTSQLFAQREIDPDTKPSFGERIYTGGNLGLQFGNYTLIDVSPSVGYMITDRFSAGVGVTYQYIKLKIPGFAESSQNIFGYRTFARYNVTQQLFAYTEFENIKWDPQGDGKEWVPGLFVGGGYFTPIAGRAGISAMVLYNLQHDNLRSQYNSPWVIRGGITF